MRRLLDIQGQLFAMRSLAKEAAEAQQQLLDGAATGAGSDAKQQQLLLSNTLSRMARSSADGYGAVPTGQKRE
jgi:hypothetical protein